MANLHQRCNKDSRRLRRRGRTLAYLGLLSLASVAASGRIEAQGVKISALPDATSAGLTDMIPCVQGDTTRRCTPAEFLALLTGGVGIGISGQTISTASNEADFLISGALTCGASTQGKVQVHSTTPLQYCDNAGTPTLRYAAYGNATGECLSVADNSIALGTKTTGGYAASVSEAGPATTASAAVSDPANCSAGSVGGGVDASWIAQDCLDPITETELDSLAELNTQLTTTIADGPHTADTDDQSASEVVYTPVDGADWTNPDPDDVADGLDKLADRLTTEEAKADDDVPESGDFGALALTGPVTSSGVATSIANDAITEAMLKSVNASTDEFCLTREDTTGDFEWQACGGAVNSFETITPTGGDPVVADSATDNLSFSCGNGIFCNGNAASDQIGFGIVSYQAGFLSDLDTTDLTCGTDAVGKAGVLDNGKFQYCDGNDTSVLRSGYLDADGTDDDLPDADEIVESMLKAVDSATDEECLTFETTTGDFEWQSCGAGGGIGGTLGTTDNAATRADGTGGATAQGSALAIEDYVSTSPASDYVSVTPFGADSIISTRLNYVGGNGSPGVYGAGILINSLNVGIQASGNYLKTWDGGGGNASILGGPDYFFNGITSSFPRLRRNGVILELVLGDESAFTQFSAGNVKANGAFLAAPQTLTIVDNGTGSAATGTLTFTKSLAKCDCGDANGCDVTLSETGMVDGWQWTVVNISANPCNFADTSGVSELPAGGVALGQWDSLSGYYVTDRFVLTSTSNN